MRLHHCFSLSQKSKIWVVVTEIKGIVKDTFSRRPQMTQVLYFYCLASKSDVLETMETGKTQSLAHGEMCNIPRE